MELLYDPPFELPFEPTFELESNPELPPKSVPKTKEDQSKGEKTNTLTILHLEESIKE